MTVNATIDLHPKQMQFFLCQDSLSGFIGGVGSGKTYVGSVKMLESVRKPGTLNLIVAPTYRMLQDATYRTFTDVLKKYNILYSTKSSDFITSISGGGEILWRSADNPDRLRGPSINRAWIDEPAECPEETLDIVLGRLRAGGKLGDCILTGTPKGRNWMWKQREFITMFHAKIEDNIFLAPEYITMLRKKYVGEFARQELDGEFVSMEGLVYPSFNRDIHVIKRNDSDFSMWALALDEGYTNPAVILLVGLDSDMRLHVAREFYKSNVLQGEIVTNTHNLYLEKRAQFAIVDSAAAGLIADLQDSGVHAIAHKGRVLDGIAKVQEYLQVQGDGRPRLTFDPSCVNGINEFEAYAWAEGKDVPIKKSDHFADAIRYLVDFLNMTVEYNEYGYSPVQISGNY